MCFCLIRELQNDSDKNHNNTSVRVFIENENRTRTCSPGGQSHNLKKGFSLENCYTMQTMSRKIRNKTPKTRIQCELIRKQQRNIRDEDV